MSALDVGREPSAAARAAIRIEAVGDARRVILGGCQVGYFLTAAHAETWALALRRALDAFAAARVAEERAIELGAACFIASQVGELGSGMTSPFREGVETACEEIIHRLMESGAPRLEDTEESRAVRARLTDPALRAPEGAPGA